MYNFGFKVYHIYIIFQISTLSKEAERLMDSHKDQAEQISNKQTEIADNWEKLKNKVQFYFLMILKLVKTWKNKYNTFTLCNVHNYNIVEILVKLFKKTAENRCKIPYALPYKNHHASLISLLKETLVHKFNKLTEKSSSISKWPKFM